MFSWLLRPLHISQMLFYHRPDPMLVLKINPIVGFVANNLCLVLGYLDKFLYYQTLTGWPWENLLKKLNHTKDNQSSDTRKLGYVPYRWCLYIISWKIKILQRRLSQMTWRYTGLHLVEVLNVSLTCDFTNTAGCVICISPVLQNCCFLHCMCVRPLIK